MSLDGFDLKQMFQLSDIHICTLMTAAEHGSYDLSPTDFKGSYKLRKIHIVKKCLSIKG